MRKSHRSGSKMDKSVDIPTEKRNRVVKSLRVQKCYCSDMSPTQDICHRVTSIQPSQKEITMNLITTLNFNDCRISVTLY